MGFFDTIKKGADALNGAMAKKQESINRYKDMFQGYPPDRLRYIFEHESGDRKLAAGLLLKEMQNEDSDY